MKKILITGGAGNIGRELAAVLAQRGNQVRVFDVPTCDFSALEGLSRVEVVEGDIREPDDVQAAVKGIDTVIHLAAILPPTSEESRERTFAVNATGTRNVAEAVEKEGGKAHLIFISSVCVYGDTSADEPPVQVTHPLCPLDLYAESKIESERIICSSDTCYTILRISPIAIPAFLEPPEVWPFMCDQRVEFISRTDVIEALSASAQNVKVKGKILNIAGGESWRMKGSQYVERLYEVMGVSPEEAEYLASPGWFDWYDTAEAQALLGYQRTSFPMFLQMLSRAVWEALA